MMKTLRLTMFSMLAMLFSTAMAQTEVTIDFDNDYQTLFPSITGVSSSTSHDGDFTADTESEAVNGVTVVVSAKASGSNDNRLWGSSPRLRMYSGTFTVKGTDITKIEFVSNDKFSLSTETGTLSDHTWVGKADEVVFNIGANTQLKSIVVTLGGEQVNPDDLVKTLYTEPLTQQGKFYIENKQKPEDLSYVWTFNNYGAVASAYVNGQAYATESWLLSPIIDLASATEVSLEFTHAVNKFGTIDLAKQYTAVLIKEADGEWQKLENVVYPEQESWTFVENELSLKAFEGKKVQFAFFYRSSEEVAGSWEIKPFTIKGKGEVTVTEVEQPAVEVASLAEMAKLDHGTKVELTLNNARVTYVSPDKKSVYVRDGTDGICFYDQDVFKEAANTWAITGKITGKVNIRYKALQMTVDQAAISISDVEAYQPVAISSEEAANYYADLVVLLGTSTISANEGNFYTSEDQDLQIYDTFKLGYTLTDGQQIENLTGVIVRYNDTYELAPITNITSGISTIEADSRQGAIYNLAGQRVDKAQKGIFIQNGRKVVKK